MALGRDAERLEPSNGRPPEHDVGVTFWAVHLADRIAQRLHSDAVLALAAINGTLRDGVPVQPWGIAADLYLAAGKEVSLVLAWAAEERPDGSAARRSGPGGCHRGRGQLPARTAGISGVAHAGRRGSGLR